MSIHVSKIMLPHANYMLTLPCMIVTDVHEYINNIMEGGG